MIDIINNVYGASTPTFETLGQVKAKRTPGRPRKEDRPEQFSVTLPRSLATRIVAEFGSVQDLFRQLIAERYK